MTGINPFLVLGLNVTVLGGLSDKDVLSLVQSQYRALSRIHHPDVGGIPELFALISEANEILQAEGARQELLEDYLISRTDQLALAQRELQNLEQRQRADLQAQRQHYADFIKAVVQARLSDVISPLHAGDATLVVQDRHTDDMLGRYRDADLDTRAEVFKTRGFKLVRRTSDVVSVSDLVMRKSMSQGLFTPKQFDRLGNGMTYVGVRKRVPYPDLNTWYAVDHEMKHNWDMRYEEYERALESGSKRKIAQQPPKEQDALYCFEAEAPVTTDWVLLGTIPSEIFGSSGAIEVGEATQKMLASASRAEIREELEHGFAFEQFQYYLEQLEVNFDEGRYLVAARLQGDNLRFMLAGEILPHQIYP